MLRSLISGLSGLKTHQITLDVIGNNIANINTPSFKSGRAAFSDALSLTLKGGTPPINTRGGLNPMQIGRGATIDSIDTIFIQGSLESTGNPLDLTIAGEGFFVLRHGEENLYTRDGSFGVDATGTLVDPNTGYAVQGRMANDEGQIFSSAPIQDIKLPIESLSAALATSKVSFTGNLDASAAVDDAGTPEDEAETYQTSVLVYDSLGETHNVTITFERTDANTWTWTAGISEADISITAGGTGTLVFNTNGSVQTGAIPAAALTLQGTGATAPNLPDGAAPLSISLNFSDIVQFAGSFTPVPSSRDGHGAGSLENITVDDTGTLIGTFTNGSSLKLAQLVLADFHNPAGLARVGANLYNVSMNSGAAVVGTAGAGIRASIIANALEGSNVDLASEFTKMIIAQRGFEANSRVVTTSDTILGELINLKR